MFADERLRERELFVRARKTDSDELETIKIYSVRGGKLHDLDYFCEVCNVAAYAPGLCPCCRQTLVLRETPLP
jgi:rubrerythrin